MACIAIAALGLIALLLSEYVWDPPPGGPYLAGAVLGMLLGVALGLVVLAYASGRM